jgi:hypothetical protein
MRVPLPVRLRRLVASRWLIRSGARVRTVRKKHLFQALRGFALLCLGRFFMLRFHQTPLCRLCKKRTQSLHEFFWQNAVSDAVVVATFNE